MRFPPNRDREADGRTRRLGAAFVHGRGPGRSCLEGVIRSRPACVATVGRSATKVAVSPGGGRHSRRGCLNDFVICDSRRTKKAQFQLLKKFAARASWINPTAMHS